MLTLLFPNQGSHEELWLVMHVQSPGYLQSPLPTPPITSFSILCAHKGEKKHRRAGSPASMLGYLANKRLQNLFQLLEYCVASKISLAQVALLGEEGHTLFFLLFN